MTDTITPALLQKMEEAPYLLRSVPWHKLPDKQPMYHVILNGTEIETFKGWRAHRDCKARVGNLNALHRAQFMQPLVDALRKVRARGIPDRYTDDADLVREIDAALEHLGVA